MGVLFQRVLTALVTTLVIAQKKTPGHPGCRYQDIDLLLHADQFTCHGLSFAMYAVEVYAAFICVPALQCVSGCVGAQVPALQYLL